MRIGVFDSGIGGKSVADALTLAFPDHQIMFRNDSQNVPYGTKSIDEIFKLSVPIIQSLQDDGCQIIVIACNTLTTNCITQLRSLFSVPLVGTEPMLKQACAATKSGVLAVCATPRTLQSTRYSELKSHYAANIVVLEPDCSDWAYLIETDQLDNQKIIDMVEQSIAVGADQIVLGCTHYHWIEQRIVEVAGGRAAILQPEKLIIARVAQLLKKL